MEKVVDDKLSVDERATALDELELLIEDLDNSKDFVKLNMHGPLLLLVNRVSDQRLKTLVLWVLGTMVQNNPVVKKSVSFS
jgi:hsp70-interacting protein